MTPNPAAVSGTPPRWDPAWVARRVALQHAGRAALLHQGEGVMRIERFLPVDAIVMTALRVAGLAARARRELFDIRRVDVCWQLPNLPRAFDGFRLLQLSDLHVDIDPQLPDAIASAVRQVPHDAAVITGDFLNKTSGDFGAAVAGTAQIVPLLAETRWGILGNHDDIEMVSALEQIGLPMLVNETVVIEHDGERLWLAGIDDPHFYRTHDLVAVRQAIPADGCAILLAHSPEVMDEAAALGFTLQLSGHTHGGQLCLPGGRPVVVPCKLPGRYIKGRWRHGSLQGYTSPGTGSCGAPARLNCPPEVTLHTLRCVA